MASMHDSLEDGKIDVALFVVGGAVERKPACNMVAIKRASGMHRTPEIVVLYTNVLSSARFKEPLDHMEVALAASGISKSSQSCSWCEW